MEGYGARLRLWSGYGARRIMEHGATDFLCYMLWSTSVWCMACMEHGATKFVRTKN